MRSKSEKVTGADFAAWHDSLCKDGEVKYPLARDDYKNPEITLESKILGLIRECFNNAPDVEVNLIWNKKLETLQLHPENRDVPVSISFNSTSQKKMQDVNDLLILAAKGGKQIAKLNGRLSKQKTAKVRGACIIWRLLYAPNPNPKAVDTHPTTAEIHYLDRVWPDYWGGELVHKIKSHIDKRAGMAFHPTNDFHTEDSKWLEFASSTIDARKKDGNRHIALITRGRLADANGIRFLLDEGVLVCVMGALFVLHGPCWIRIDDFLVGRALAQMVVNETKGTTIAVPFLPEIVERESLSPTVLRLKGFTEEMRSLAGHVTVSEDDIRIERQENGADQVHAAEEGLRKWLGEKKPTSGFVLVALSHETTLAACSIRKEMRGRSTNFQVFGTDYSSYLRRDLKNGDLDGIIAVNLEEYAEETVNMLVRDWQPNHLVLIRPYWVTHEKFKDTDRTADPFGVMERVDEKKWLTLFTDVPPEAHPKKGADGSTSRNAFKKWACEKLVGHMLEWKMQHSVTEVIVSGDDHFEVILRMPEERRYTGAFRSLDRMALWHLLST